MEGVDKISIDSFFNLSVDKELIVKSAALQLVSSLSGHFTRLILLAMLTSLASAQTCNPSKPITKPDTRYSAANNGAEVLDKITNLIWQRCSMGQRWNGKTCLGKAIGYNWDKAQEASKELVKKNAPAITDSAAQSVANAHKAIDAEVVESAESEDSLPEKTTATIQAPLRNLDWRLPTHKELFALAELACRGPAINTLWFPSTSGNFYWSSSIFSDDASFVWGVDFSDGRAGYDSKAGNYSVRLVRSSL